MIALPIKYDTLLKIRFISTTVDSEFPKGVTKVGETSSSKPSYVGLIQFTRGIKKVSSNRYVTKNMCMFPVEETW